MMNWINTFGDAYYLDTQPFFNTMFGKNEGMSDEEGKEEEWKTGKFYPRSWFYICI